MGIFDKEFSEAEDVYIPDGHMYTLPIGKVRRFVHHWNLGRKDHFPICCVFRFSLENALQDGKILPNKEASGEKRGSIDRGYNIVFVPCGIFHHKTRNI